MNTRIMGVEKYLTNLELGAKIFDNADWTRPGPLGKTGNFAFKLAVLKLLCSDLIV